MVMNAVTRRLTVLCSSRPLAATLIISLFGILVNLLFVYLLRYFRPTDRSRHHRHTHSSSRKEHKKGRSGESRKSVPNVLLLLGIPGSGKTTWAEQYLERCDHSYAIVSVDETRMSLTGRADDISKEEEVCEAMIREVVDHIKNRQNIIVDGGVHAMDEAFRRRLMDAASSCNRMVKDFPIKALFARARLSKDAEEGKVRYYPSEIELDELEVIFNKAQARIKEEGWKPLLESAHSRSRRA
ncbi:putative retrotransposon hot spot (RHS) protein [Trypanosoma grayi]|uniref:putative retrotransposon hot spot (RHS) protein n=1 Tax=Trypanosoma grayi TaxID=71804 RepID=UPI0004F4374F|nr:putative retrotransposon hot spot (RHS) protein [Trypanosoma grayi]KEG12283.1 putative retrotransposon hot spot (RHS) protein [Trypanosoma grayi]